MSQTSKRRWQTFASAAAAAVLCTATFAEDTLKLKDGRTLTGRLVSDDGKTVVFETHHRGMRVKGNYPKSSVASISREDAAGPTYYALPIIGAIGRQNDKDPYITADLFRTALAEVRRSKPDYVVLVIDSPGGGLDEMQKIIEVIGDNPDLRFVAYVKRAISAAAIIALRCPTVCMASGGTMGGAVPFKMGPDGTPQLIEEKFQSILRAEFRRAAEQGGHSPLIAQAMMDIDLELLVTSRDGKPLVIEPTNGVNATPIKRKGRILTLTADEAKSCGVSIGTAATIEEIAPLLGSESWSSADDKAWFQLLNAADAQQEHAVQQQEKASRMKAWATTVKGIQEEMDKLEEQFNAKLSQRDAATKQAQQLTKQINDDIAALKTQWEAERVSVAGSSTNNNALSAATRRRLADLDASYDTRQTEMVERAKPDIEAAKAKARTADDELKALHQQILSLREKVPPKPKN